MNCRDTEVLCSSLTYSQGPPEVLQGDPPGAATRVYRPPFDEFEVLRVEVPAGESEIVTAKHVSASVLRHVGRELWCRSLVHALGLQL